jgi:hypothetical protein
MADDLLTALLMGRQGKLTGGAEAKVSATPEPPWHRKVLEVLTGYPASPETEIGPADVAMAAIPVWHGSPALFRKFSLNKLGSTSKAAMYGPGINTATAQQEAMRYRPGPSAHFLQERGRLEGPDPDNELLERLVSRAKTTDPQELIAHAARDTRDYDFDSVARRLHAHEPVSIRPGGYLYKADLDVSPDEMLLFNRMFREQPQHIQDLMRKQFPTAHSMLEGKGLIYKLMESQENFNRVTGQTENVDLPRVARMLDNMGIKSTAVKDLGLNGDYHIVHDPTRLQITDVYDWRGKRVP